MTSLHAAQPIRALDSWARDVLRITRVIAQYFYPQMQTKVMNEGAATYVHYRIVTTLHDEGRLSDGAYLEFLQTHTNVVYQPMFDTHGYNDIHTYAMGYGKMNDIKHILTTPTQQEREKNE